MVAKIALITASFYTLAITLLSLIKLGKVSIGSFNPTDKLLHALAYLLLVVVWQFFFILRPKSNSSYKKNLFIISGLAIIFGMLIEVLQGVLTSYRRPDWYDILANTTGVLFAAILFFFLEKLLLRLKHKISLIF